MAWHTEDADPVRKVSIVGHGRTGGATTQLPEERKVYSSALSDETAASIDHEVATLLENEQAHARTVIEDHHDELERVVKLLMEEETVTSDQLRDQLGPPASETAGGR